MRKFLAALPLVALLAGAAVALPADAAVSTRTARATGTLGIYAGPGHSYRLLGYLPNGSNVHLYECTRSKRWCRIVNPDGPEGWVLASYLVGSPAKVEVTPFDPFRHFFNPEFYDPRHPKRDPEE